jgi:hypothetical protein
MTEQIILPSTPPSEPESPRYCSICDDITDAPICVKCLALAGPQSIMHQHDWESWEPPEETLTRRPRLVEVESQFQPALTPSSSKKSPSGALKRRLQSLRPSKRDEGVEGKSPILSALIIFLIIVILFYIGSIILGIDPLYLVMRLFTN